MIFALQAPSEKTKHIYANLFVTVMALLPLVAFFSARSMAVLPGIIAVGFFAAWPFFYKEKIQYSRFYFICAGLLSLLCALSALWSPDTDFAIEKSAKIALVLLPGALLFSLAQSFRHDHVQWLRIALPATLITSCLMIAGELAFNLPLHRWSEGLPAYAPLTSAVVNRSLFCAGSLVVMCTMIVFSSAFSERAKITIIAGLIASIFLALALSQSQSNQLAIGVALLLVFAFPYKQKKVYYGLAGLMAGLILVSPWLAQWMFQTFADPADKAPWISDGYAAERMEIWDFISRHLVQNIWHGYGVDSTRFMTFDAAGRYYESGSVLHPHNFVLQLWGEFGVWGAVAGAAFFTFLFLRLKNICPEKARMVLPTLAYAGIVGVIGYGMWQGWWLGQLTVIMAMLGLAMRQNR